MSDKNLDIAYECLSSIGNSFELESMICEVAATFFSATKALSVSYYESIYSISSMVTIGKEFSFKIDEESIQKNKCFAVMFEDLHIIVLPLKMGYFRFIYKNRQNDIANLTSMICGFQRKINFAISACVGVKELEELNSNLENRVKESVSKIREHEKMLLIQSKYAAMGEMIEMIAHQWRQPITTIGMISNNVALDLILNNVDEIDTEMLKRDLEGINRQVKYLSDTIDDFKNFFKGSKSKQKVFLSEIIDKAVSLIIKQLEQKNIIISIENRCDNTLLNTYKNELIQVLLNIIANAKDALTEHNSKEKKISIVCKKNRDSFIISISDNAGGIKDEVISKIFDPYFSTKKAKNGTGLGLYMSKVIINEHLDGEIFAKNIDYGAEFTIKLPICVTNNKE